MKKTIIRYGLISSVVLIVLFLIEWAIFNNKNYAAQEVMGYASMIIAMLFVFFGIKHYRDKENGGLLSFGQGMKVGVLIVLIPALVYGLFDVLYILVLNPGFMNDYFNYYLAEMQKTMTAQEFEKARASMESQKAMFSKPVVNFMVMFLTVFVIGMIVTVISSLILRRRARTAIA